MTQEEVKNYSKEKAQEKYCSYSNNTPKYEIAQIHAYSDGFLDGAKWVRETLFHKMKDEVPLPNEKYSNDAYPQIPCLVKGQLSTGYGYGVRYWNVTEQCWDDEECDDYECDRGAVEEWVYMEDLIPNKEG